MSRKKRRRLEALEAGRDDGSEDEGGQKPGTSGKCCLLFANVTSCTTRLLRFCPILVSL